LGPPKTAHDRQSCSAAKNCLVGAHHIFADVFTGYPNRLNLLFHNNEKEIGLLGQHPAILWKLESVRMRRLDHEMS